MSGDCGNPALRALLAEAAISNAALARAVVASGAEEGVHLGTTPTSVRRMLDGAQPRWPVPRLVAKVVGRRLRREVSLAECGFADNGPPAEDPHDGLRSSGTLDGTLQSVIMLSSRDLSRRNFLIGSSFAAAAFAEPALHALTVPPARITDHGGRDCISVADVSVLQDHFNHLRRLDHQYGSGRIREQGVQLLHGEATRLLHSSYSAKVGSALLRVIAQVSWLAGSMAADVGRHALAQRYYIQTLNLALSNGDMAYAANILGHMSRLTVHIGHGALTDADRTANGRHAVALARAGRSLAGSATAPVLGALLLAIEARGHALLGDAKEARRVVLEAERTFERSRPDSEPRWLDFYTQGEFFADVGRSLRDTGETEHAAQLIDQALTSYEPWRTRSRSFVLTDLATTHLLSRNDEQALIYGADAMKATTAVASRRAVDRIRTLHRQVHPLRAKSSHLRALDDRLTAFRTRSEAAAP
ncbi:hypothetical protein ACFV9C_27180 [Kribbella sp. NPDC059898]|uniref:hypothetical protein n=1 Tax=Kribbella sp. NPDC059898 TaxID=3346995 RepID=UPI00364862B7